ncbi:MAG TPA: LPS assembly lipoprotein LptE [Opitutaceae bacterium]
MRPGLIFSCLFALGLLASGCAHYQLGTGGKLTFQRLYVAPVANETALPQAVALVSAQIRESLLRDGRVTLVSAEADADATLVITLTNYGREVATVRPDDTGLARKFNLTLEAKATLRDQRTGTLLFENRALSSQRQAFTDSGQLQAEYQTLPLLAASLAESVRNAVLDVW